MKLEEYVETEEVDDYDYEEYEDEYDEELEENDEADDYDYIEKTNTNVLKILGFCSIWFIRIGMIIAIILFVTFIVTGEVKTAFLYVVGLIISFFFGYMFMFMLDVVFMKRRDGNLEEMD